MDLRAIALDGTSAHQDLEANDDAEERIWSYTRANMGRGLSMQSSPPKSPVLI